MYLYIVHKYNFPSTHQYCILYVIEKKNHFYFHFHHFILFFFSHTKEKAFPIFDVLSIVTLHNNLHEKIHSRSIYILGRVAMYV